MGLRGPGESQLESDKRIIRKKIAALKKELLQLHRHRSLHRVRREKMVRVWVDRTGQRLVYSRLSTRTHPCSFTTIRATP